MARPQVAGGGTDSNMEGSCEDINPLTPKDPYSGRTAPLTLKTFHFIYLFNKYRY